MMNQLYNNTIEQSATLGEKIDAQETKIQGSYAMSEALCKRISILSQDIDGQTKLLSGMAGILIPKNESDAFFKALDEYDTIIKDLMKKPQSPPPPTADENDSPPQDSNNSYTKS
jgi:hypothetical protein